jgi:hypothetical protein
MRSICDIRNTASCEQMHSIALVAVANVADVKPLRFTICGIRLGASLMLRKTYLRSVTAVIA